MGCSQSRLDNEEAVKLCKDRKQFIKQAVEQRAQFATGHAVYIQSLKRVSAALLDYFEGRDESCELSLDSFKTPPFTPVKKTTPAFIPISSKSFTPTTIEFSPKTTLKVNCLSPSGNPAISVEERPQSPQVVRVETCYHMHQFGSDGLFPMQSPPKNPSIFAYSPYNRPNTAPPSPESSQWDSFWNPFSSLDYYGYPTRSSLDPNGGMDDEIRGLRQVREEEGIPDLEKDEPERENFVKRNEAEEHTKIDVNPSQEEVTVEDVDEHGEEEEKKPADAETGTANEVTDSQANGSETAGQEMSTGNQEAKEETPGFTVYVDRRPTSMAEVIRDLEAQFTIICNAANDVSALLEAKKSQYLSASNEPSASKLLNPVVLFRSSSRSSSSRFLMNSSNSKNRDEGYEGTDDPPEEDCLLSVGHQSTLDRLYAWEKKLYEEVRSGARVRIAYEKKCQQIGNHDINGEEPSSVLKTREVIRDLHTQITVSIHSVEAISRRIETLRDQELHPQLLELVQGLAKMWKVMAECHQTQKRTLDEAKILLVDTDARKQCVTSLTDPQRLARSAINLETELRRWGNTFESWITSQRSYIQALTGWLLRCVRCDHDPSKLAIASSPRRSSGTHPLFGLCVQWSRRLDALEETAVLDGIDFFAAGIGSLYAQQLREETRRNQVGSKQHDQNTETVEVGQVEEVMNTEKLAEVAIKVLCAGMSTAMTSMAEFAVDYAEGYIELAKKWENVNLQQISCGAGTLI